MAGLLSLRRSATSPPSRPSRDKNSNTLCPVRPPQTAIGRCWRPATNWDFAGERARPGCRFRRRAKTGFTRHLTPALSPNSRWRRGRNARRLFEKPAMGLAGLSSAKPEASNGHFLSPGERIKGEGERQHKLFPSFIHRKLPLAARLGHCWGARPSRWPFSPSRPPSSQRDNVTIARRFNAGSSPAPARVLPGRLNAWPSVSAIANDFGLQTSVVPAGLGLFSD